MADPFFPKLRADYTEVPSSDGKKGTNVFVRYVAAKPAGATGTPTVEFGPIKVKQELMEDRGLSAFQLYLTFHIDPKSRNRFDFTVTEAAVDTMIWVNPKNQFERLSAFAKVYAEFAATATLHKGWRQAADRFAEKHITRHNGQTMPDGTIRGGHWSTTFTGIRAKTIRHELDHVKFAVKGCQGLIDNFLAAVRKVSDAPDASGTPRQRVDKVVDDLMGRFGFPYFDVAAQEHRQIAKRDCFFMVAWYQRRELKRFLLDHAAYEVELSVLGDDKFPKLMEQLGEVYPWL
jgi:hypothetical protein